jgi:hypothetical protein
MARAVRPIHKPDTRDATGAIRMTSSQFNGAYRPLVKQAWLQYCERTGTAPNNKPAYTIWYQQTLHDMTKGRVHTTKGIHEREQRHLLVQFHLLAGDSNSIAIKGWSTPQIARFLDLAKSAHRAAQTDGDHSEFKPWAEAVLAHHDLDKAEGYWVMPDKTETFDRIMADLAILANDEYWIRRTAEQGEIRIKWQLCRFLVDLDHVDPANHHGWAYVCGIHRQAGMLPSSIDDCPAQTLWRVLQMLDTHIRRLCRDLGIRPMDLPTRTHLHAHGIAISGKASHLHIGHELEHISQAVTYQSDALSDIPF